MRGAFPAREYEVIAASTPEQAVAFCLSNHISAVVLDSEFSTEAGWSAAQTLKMVNRNLRVMLLLKSANGTVPSGVDAVAHSAAGGRIAPSSAYCCGISLTVKSAGT
jgi:ActR/RegA family two-component response regulator